MEGYPKSKSRNIGTPNGFEEGADYFNNQSYGNTPEGSFNPNSNSVPASPSLKLKIKLPGKIKDNLNQSSDNISFSFNNGTPGKESQESQGRERLTDSTDSSSNPQLKIVIKKTDYTPTTSPQMHQSPYPQSRPVLLNLIPFPKFTDHTLFQKTITSNKEEGNLHEWSEKDFAALKDELEEMRLSLRKFSSKLQEQMEVLEDVRSTPMKKDNIRKSRDQSGGNHKKQKIRGEFGSKEDEDLEYVEDFDEIDVIDDDPFAFEDQKPSRPRGRAKGSTNKNSKRGRQSQQAQTPAPVVPSTPQTPSTPQNPPPTQQKNTKSGGRDTGPAARAGARNKNRNKKNNEDYDSEEITYGKGGKNSFWNDMEAYFGPYTENDLKFIAPLNPDADEAITQIPGLGRHYREIWAEEDNEDPERFAKIASEISEDMETDKPIACGDLTSRLLSALIEENVVPNTAELQKEFPIVKENGTVADPAFLSNLGTQQPAKEVAPGEQGFPLETPPTYDYSYHGMLTLEERIKLELRSIGLLDDEDLEVSNSREDDEICTELRILQKQLRERVVQNNIVRQRLHSQLPAIVQKEEREKQERMANQNLEKSYQKLQSKKKKSRKAAT